jgi:hypothetical protein
VIRIKEKKTWPYPREKYQNPKRIFAVPMMACRLPVFPSAPSARNPNCLIGSAPIAAPIKVKRFWNGKKNRGLLFWMNESL